MYKFVLVILFSFSLCGCKENEPGLKDYDYLIFGHFYGFCIGEACVEIFKVTDADVYEDTKDEYPRNNLPYIGNFKKMDQSFYASAKGLEDHIPSKLINNQEKVIGQPDAGDWGGIYFEYSATGKKEYWILDKNRSNLPEDLIPFVEQIEKRIEALQPD